MKKFLLLLLTISLSFSLFGQQKDVTRCATMEYMDYLMKEHPETFTNMQTIEERIQQVLNSNKLSQDVVISIPVVVHVLWNTSAQNISDQMITSQIQVLTEDYRKMYGTNGWNTHPSGSDVKVEFHLADRDPNGLPHSGINRVYTTYTSFNYINDNTYLKSLSYWPSDKYLNLWVCNLSNGILGYAQFPGGPAATDGVVILYSAFGLNSPFYPYNIGRTTTHEVGHWLNLIHIWGDVSTCDGTDYCNDTPPCSGQYFSQVPSCPVPSQCGYPRMIENYMDYSDDGCMNLFTNDQTSRMRAAYTVYRYNLLVSAKEGLAVTQTGVDYTFTDIFGQPFASINFSSLGTVDSITVEVFPGQAPLNVPPGSKAVKRYFKITPEGTGYSANIKLYYKDAEVVGFTNGENNLQLYRYESGAWAYQGGTVNTSSNFVALNNVTSFSSWAISDPSDNPIPVELVSFKTDITGNDVNLSWMTVTETNNYGFYVERAVSSANYEEVEFKEISFVRGNGNSTEIRSYAVTDANLNQGTYIYRLRITDNDGSFTYSEAVVAEIESPKTYSLEQNYPNPFNPSTTVAYTIPEAAYVTIKIFDALGNQVALLVNDNKEAGTYEVNFDASKIPSGIYYCSMYANGYSKTNKMMLLK